MRFKNWLAEWEGNTFMQAPEYTNDEIFQSAGVKSKYISNRTRKKDEKEDDEDKEMPDEETGMEKIKSLFGFTKDDELDELRKKVRRKND